jgi:hypothetical protein|tara:strand:- start:26 stop:433 length:408 start_codon:yes stop_codon:yes gene_type:complete
MMRLFLLILTGLLPTLTVADTISITVPSAVADVVKKYRADCTEDGGELELDGDEVFRLRTEEGEEAFVIRASFTCGDLGHLYCGAMGHCPTYLVVDNKYYDTNRILQGDVARISKAPDGTISYWMHDGHKLKIDN